MIGGHTTQLYQVQPICSGMARNSFVALGRMAGIPDNPGRAGLWAKGEREARGWSAAEIARRINGIAEEDGDPTRVSQQVISKFEQGNTKRMPSWVRLLRKVLDAADDESSEDAYLGTGKTDTGIAIRLLPTFAGLGGGGTGEGDEGHVTFSRDLIEGELRIPAEALLAMVAEGNSMLPDFEGGDQILVDTRRKNLAQPGAFCLWDIDGHVIKYLERVANSEPPRVRVVSKNAELYPPREALLDEINLIGKVVWYGRRIR